MFSFTGFTRRTRKKNDSSRVNERFNARISSNKRASQFISALRNRITEKRKNKMARKIQTQFQTFQTRKKFLSDLATRKNTAATKLQRKFRTFNTFNAMRPLVSRPKIEDVCSICLDTMDWSSEGSVKKLECGHLFHKKCIDNYIQQTNHFACPLCKTLSVDDKLKDIYLKAKDRYVGLKLHIISGWIKKYKKIIKETKEEITKTESLYKRSMELFIQLKSKYTNNPSSYLLKRLNNTILDINEYIKDINDYRDEYCKHVNNYLIQIYKDNLLPESNIIGPYGNVIIERLELPHIKELPLMEAIPPVIKTSSRVEMSPSRVDA